MPDVENNASAGSQKEGPQRGIIARSTKVRNSWSGAQKAVAGKAGKFRGREATTKKRGGEKGKERAEGHKREGGNPLKTPRSYQKRSEILKPTRPTLT